MDKSRVESTIFFIEKISFSLKLFSGHFYGQSFIKTVRGPFNPVIINEIFRIGELIPNQDLYVLGPVKTILSKPYIEKKT